MSKLVDYKLVKKSDYDSVKKKRSWLSVKNLRKVSTIAVTKVVQHLQKHDVKVFWWWKLIFGMLLYQIHKYHGVDLKVLSSSFLLGRKVKLPFEIGNKFLW